MTTERDKWLRFAATPIGAAFERFDNANSHAWALDTSESFKEYPNEKRLKEAWDNERQARREFLDLLYKIPFSQEVVEANESVTKP